MSTGPLPRKVDHRKLAADKAKLEGEVPVAEFERLAEQLIDSEGQIRVKLQFRKGKWQRPYVTGVCSGELHLECQACLEPMSYPITAQIRTLLLESVEQLEELDQSEDGQVSDDEKVSLVEILEDYLLVGLPMVARHPEGECAKIAVAPSAAAVESSDEPETYRPFAGLAELTKDLKRS